MSLPYMKGGESGLSTHMETEVPQTNGHWVFYRSTVPGLWGLSCRTTFLLTRPQTSTGTKSDPEGPGYGSDTR